MARMKLPIESVPSNHFAGGARTGRRRTGVELPDILNARATVTVAELHVYADGTSGDDANDGLSVSTPINVGLIIDGGSGVTVVDDNGGSNYTADIHSTSTIGDSAETWVANAFRGYMVEILSGSLIGQTRGIYSNDATTITVIGNFSADPGTAVFRIVRPATTLQGALSLLGISGSGYVKIQRLYFDTASALVVRAVQTSVFSLSTIVMASTTYGAMQSHDSTISCIAAVYDPMTFTSSTALSASLGLSVLSSAVNVAIGRAAFSGVFGSYIAGRLLVHGCVSQNFLLGMGTQVLGGVILVDHSCIRGPHSTYWPDGATMFGPQSGYRSVVVSNSSGVGLRMVKSEGTLDGSSQINGCSSHGIELDQSKLRFTGAFAGTGNAGAGVYAHSGSVVLTKSGAPPTLTGTVGDLAVTSPTVQESTWAAIDAGTPVAVLAEMTMAKEVA